MHKINLRLVTMIPALFACEEENNIQIKVIDDDGESITDYKPTLEDVSNDIFGVENIYAYRDRVILEVKKDPDDSIDFDFDEDDQYEADEREYDNYPVTGDYLEDMIKDSYYTGPQLVMNKKETVAKKDAIKNDYNTIADDPSIENIDYLISYNASDNVSMITIKLKNNDERTILIDGDCSKMSKEKIEKIIKDQINGYTK